MITIQGQLQAIAWNHLREAWHWKNNSILLCALPLPNAAHREILQCALGLTMGSILLPNGHFAHVHYNGRNTHRYKINTNYLGDMSACLCASPQCVEHLLDKEIKVIPSGVDSTIVRILSSWPLPFQSSILSSNSLLGSECLNALTNSLIVHCIEHWSR